MLNDFLLQANHLSVKHWDTVGPFIEIMLGVYVRCPWNEAVHPIDLVKAHDHVFGNVQQKHAACATCIGRFRRQRAKQLIFFGRDDDNYPGYEPERNGTRSPEYAQKST